MPSFTIGIDRCEGWGDWQIPEYDIPVEQGFSQTYSKYRAWKTMLILPLR